MTAKHPGVAAICLWAGVAAVSLGNVPGAAPRQTVPPAQSGGGRGSGPPPVITVPAPPPAPARGSSAISGIVIDGVTRRPIAGAQVLLSGGPAGGLRPRQMTDEAGRFIFTQLPAAADFALSASHPDYLFGQYSAAPGEPAARVAVLESQLMANATIALYKPASLSGTIVDERGEPVVGVPVRILKAVEIAGQMRRATGPVAETDDRGMYRVPDLTPGSYFVHVPSVQITLADGTVRPPIAPQRPLAIAHAPGGIGAIVGHFPTPPAPGRGYAMAYHPAARAAAEALPITLEYGESRTNADVQLTLVPTVRVSGTLNGPPQAVASMPVWLVPAGDEASGAGGEAALTISTGEGAFAFLNVPAGRYTLIASRSQSEYSVGGRGKDRLLPERGDAFNISMSGGQVAGAPGVSYATRGRSGVAAFGRIQVEVDNRDVTTLVVPLVTGVRVSGHFLWDGQPAAPSSVTSAPMVGLESADGDLSLGFPQSAFARLSGEAASSPVPFTIEGVLPGRYLMGAILVTGGFTLEGAEWRGRDLLSTPLDVTGENPVTGVVVRLTTKKTSVSGTVRDGSGAAATGGSVIAFPVSPAAWETIGFRGRRFASAPIAAGGSYVLTQLPPGEYLVTVIPAADRARWLTRDFLLAAAAGATRVRIEPGATLMQDLRVDGARR